MRKWIVAAGIALVVIVLALAVALHAVVPKLRAAVRQQTQDYLQSHFLSSVHFDDFEVSLGWRLRVSVQGLVLRHQGRTDIPPLIEVRNVSFYASLVSLLRHRPEVELAQLDGLQIHIPPRIPGGPPLIPATKRNLAEEIPIVIHELRADDVVLVTLRRDSDKPPNEYPIHHLEMRDFSFDRPTAFHALLTIPKPRGDIDCDGEFGPWQADQPSETPVNAKYTFSHADLSTLKGLRGTLSSTGKFSGPLDYISIEGVTDTPDFALRTSARPMALHTDFTGTVDGTNGNTILTNVTAKFLHTTVVAHGKVIDEHPLIKGRTVALDAVSTDSRVEDLLALAVAAEKPVMTGSARWNATILIPETDEDLIDRMKIDGQFGLGKVHFTSSTVQGKVDSLSRKGQGKPADLDISDSVSDLNGNFKMANAAVYFSNLKFAVEGASVALAGTYNIDSGQMDFHGKLQLQAKLSQTMTGWKSVMLKPFNGFFAGKHGGTEVPIKITGTRENPSFGLDFH